QVLSSRFSVLSESQRRRALAESCFPFISCLALQWLFLRNSLGLPLFCAAADSKRRLLSASFAAATGRGVERKLPRLRAGTTGLRKPSTGILQSWLRNRLPASSAEPRLGCGPFFGGARELRAGHDFFCLRIGPRSDRTWEVDVRHSQRSLARRTPGSAGIESRGQLPSKLSRPAGRGACLSVRRCKQNALVLRFAQDDRLNLWRKVVGHDARGRAG